MIDIRKATIEDMPQVLELIHELAVFEKEPDAVEVTVRELEKEGFGEQASFVCFVAELDKEIVGIALVYFKFSTWKGKILHLEDLIVKKAHRGKGIGGLLYRQVMKYGFNNDVKRIDWVVLNWNTNAIDFYEKRGAKILKNWSLVEKDKVGIENFVNSKEEF